MKYLGFYSSQNLAQKFRKTFEFIDHLQQHFGQQSIIETALELIA